MSMQAPISHHFDIYRYWVSKRTGRTMPARVSLRGEDPLPHHKSSIHGILRQGGHEIVAASPKSGIKSITGEGLKEAMAGATVVIDLANSPSFELQRGTERTI